MPSLRRLLTATLLLVAAPQVFAARTAVAPRDQEQTLTWRGVNAGGTLGRRDVNCVYCTISADRTMDGHATQAMPIRSMSREGRQLNRSTLSRQLGIPRSRWKRSTTPFAATQLVEAWPVGAKGVVVVAFQPLRPFDLRIALERELGKSRGFDVWRRRHRDRDRALAELTPDERAVATPMLDGDLAHAMNVVRTEHGVEVRDAQSGKPFSLGRLGPIKYIDVARTKDLPATTP